MRVPACQLKALEQWQARSGVGSICSGGEPRAGASRESPEAAGGKDGACIQDQLTFRGLKSKAFKNAIVYISVRKKNLQTLLLSKERDIKYK